MAPRGTKRAASKAPKEAPEAKRVNDFLKQQGVSKTTYGALVEIIEHPLAELPEDCQNLMKAALPWSICVPRADRHECQEAGVSMLSDVIATVREKMQAEIDSAIQAVSKVEEGESTVQDRLNTAQGEADEAEVARKERTKELADASEKLAATRKSLKEATAEGAKQEKALKALLKEKAAFEETFSNSFRKIKSIEWEDAEGAGLLKDVTNTAGKLGLEESLLTALPNVGLKRERGPFDNMVLDSLEESLKKKIDELTQKETQLNSDILAQNATIEVANKTVETSTTEQQASAEELSRAQEHQAKTAEALRSVKHEAANGETILAKAKDTQKEKEEVLTIFQDFNVGMFEMLRDRSLEKPPSQEETVPDAAAVEMGA